MTEGHTYTAFRGARRLASGSLEAVAQALAAEAAPQGAVVIFDDATGRPVELDVRRSPAEAVSDYRERMAEPAPATPRSGRGRPRLGVVAREVTLLPRHWDWLASQPGGASATLRRLVDDARRTSAGADRARLAQEALYRVMSTLAGDLPGFEDAARALFARSDARFDDLIGRWPPDIAAYLRRLAGAERTARDA